MEDFVARRSDDQNGGPTPPGENVIIGEHGIRPVDDSSSTAVHVGDGSDEGTSSSGTEEKPTKWRPKKWVLIALAAVVMVLAIGLGSYYQNLKEDYDQAMSYYSAESYVLAAEAFQDLGSFSDSSVWYERACAWIDAKAKERAADEDATAWEEASKAYASIDDENSKDDAERCHNISVYYEASALLTENMDDKYAVSQAQTLFETCGGVKDTAEKLEVCEDCFTYLDAKELMKAGKWSEADTEFGQLNDPDFRDSHNLDAECRARINYAEAEKLFGEQHYYDALKKYEAVGSKPYEGMENLEERKAACVPEKPANGVVWRNEAYGNDNCSMTIKNSNNEDTYYKFYIGDDLVMGVYISAGGTTTFGMPTGTYRANEAFGNTWYGIVDTFGGGGDYYSCSFGGESTFELESGYSYTISNEGQGTGIGMRTTSRDSF